MMKAEQVPKEAIEAAAVMLSNGKTTAQAIAAAINAWPGMRIMPAVELDQEVSPAVVILPPHGGRGMSLTPDMLAAWQLQPIVKQQEEEITRLRAEVEKLKAALRVYAGPVGGDNFPHWSDGYPGGVMVEWNTIDFGDAARAALGGTHE